MSDVLPAKKKRADGQMSGLAGEFFVAAELLKRGLQTSLTFGNAKAIDLFVFNADTNRHFNVQVKTLRDPTWFLINPKGIKPDHIYVFVLLHKPGVAVDYFIVKGEDLISDVDFNLPSDFPGISYKAPLLINSKNDWSKFFAERSTNS